MSVFFSVIIATYNSERYLARALESIKNQSFSNYEILIVDGGSKDATLGIAEQYKNKITFVISEKDEGIYDAWNKGLKKSKGEWIMFLGSDDFLLPEALEAYAIFIKNANHEFNYISSKVNLIKNDETILRSIGKPWQWKNFKKYMCVAHVGSLHHKSLYKEYGLYNPDYKITGDYELLLRAKDKLKAGFLNRINASMQIGGVSVGNKSFSETYYAKVKSGNRNTFIAKIEMYEAKFKYYVKSILFS